ncbi:diacylglycerol/lipid kinase family protein [Candidatus Epulonipiscium viviparus]|uniref:diacylglycerol/lipid kinase family protein n=1 Tax=Candidatus Epulonipiscium viviparus TaxID=420336 RepID=UPI00016C0208|nr:YegS/Rv2252/BmrU family lipid kinase [Candidatus Epulopiscium viviparus]
MKRAILLYNPKAGNRKILNQVDYITEKIQKLGYVLTIYRSEFKGAIEKHILDKVLPEDFDLIMISGGDGTINECINGMMKKKIYAPLAILPLGTANDFANTAMIPNTIDDAINLIAKGELRFVDVGQVNDKYFINVCNMGLFSGVSHEIDLVLKKNLGKIAYYVKGIEELQNYDAMDLIIEHDNKVLTNKYVLVLIFNGKGAGGFSKMAKDADIEDGYFDLVGIKEVDFFDVPLLFLKVLQGEHLEDDKIDYIKLKHARITCKNPESKFITDIDGEVGPDFPLNISVITKQLRIYLPPKL